MESFTLIDEHGNFNEGIQKDLKLDDEKSPLAVVSIIGAQSSGKSTLLNRMFGKEDLKIFEEMDAKKGRHRTTNGIWVAKCPLEQGCILVIDTEGSDGQERKGNETFARQTALFAMAVSRVVIINIWCTEIGRESGGGWPLLRTTCEVMLQEFGRKRRQITLLFVLRDKTETPLHLLKKDITAKMGEILGEMTEHRVQGDEVLSELFKTEVRGISHYKHERENFNEEVDKLRQWIITQTASIESTSKRIPTSHFPTHAKEIWDDVKKRKDLELSSIVIMIARELCDRIANEQRDKFKNDKKWLKIKKDMETGFRRGFGMEISRLISNHLSLYNKEAKLHDKTTRDERGKQLTEELCMIIKPTYDRLVDLMRSKKLEDFKKAALDELKNKGRLETVEDQNFITEFVGQLKDADVKQANWTHVSEQPEILRSGLNDIKRLFAEVNAELDKQQEDRISAWKQIITFGSALVAGSVLAPPLAPVAAAAVPTIILPLIGKIFGLSNYGSIAR